MHENIIKANASLQFCREGAYSNLNKCSYDKGKSNLCFSKHKKHFMYNIMWKIARIINYQIVRNEYTLNVTLKEPCN